MHAIFTGKKNAHAPNGEQARHGVQIGGLGVSAFGQFALCRCQSSRPTRIAMMNRAAFKADDNIAAWTEIAPKRTNIAPIALTIKNGQNIVFPFRVDERAK